MDYEKWIAKVVIFFFGMSAGMLIIGIYFGINYNQQIIETERLQTEIAQQIKLLKMEKIYILEYALQQYHKELKGYYENIKERKQDE